MPILRLAAAQLHYHPAFEGGGHQALREPTGAWEGAGLSGLRAGTEEGDALLKQLRERIERVYVEAYRPRLEAVVRFAAGLDLDLLVLPEYAVPLALLPMVAEAAGPRLTVVAGTHTVTREGVKSAGVYERLGARVTLADVGRAIAPVLRGGKVIAVQQKLARSKLEPDLKLGEAWSTVGLGAAEMGILVCLDFLKRADGDVAPLVARGIDGCAVLAVPSLTPFSSLEHFERNAEEILYGYDRPVVYANGAAEGGTRVFTLEKDAPVVLAAGRPPALPRGVEGVVAVEVHLGAGKQRYQPVVASRPLAAAVMMDAAVWGELRKAAESVLAAEDAGEALDRIEDGREVFARAAGNQDLPEIARERWAYLAEGAEGASAIEHLRALVRDVWVEGVSTHREVERGLVEGAVRVLREVEKKAPEAQKVVTVRGWLEGEMLGRYKGVEAAGEVQEGVTDGFLPEPEKTFLLKPAEDGSFERWVRDPGPLPSKWSKLGFREWLRDNAGHYTKVHQDPISTPQVSVLVGNDGFSEVGAGLLALWGYQPSWLARSRDGWDFIILNDGRAVGCVHAVPDESDLREISESADGLPRALVVWTSRERVLLPDGESVPAGVKFTPDEIRALAYHQSHLQTLVRFFESDDGKRFVEPVARLRGGEAESAFDQLAAWLNSAFPICLLLGEFGSGKSMVSKCFAARLAKNSLELGDRSAILVDLRDWSGPVNLAGLVRRTLGVDNIAPYRFAVEEGEVVLILDGFDEMSNRLTTAELASALRSLLAWRTYRSKILLTCRTHLFIDPSEFDLIFSEATGAVLKTPGLGEIEGAIVLELQLFDERRIQDYLAKVTPDPEGAWAAMGRVHDLQNLAERPMLLDLIRQTLPELTRSEKVALGDLYEMYVQKWAEWPGLDEWLNPPQKIAFAEELARCIWNDGPEVEDGAVRVDKLSEILFREKPFDWIRRLDNDAVRLELRAGTFLVWKGGDKQGYYHFAHRSFLEYMLARRTTRDLAASGRGALDLPRFSPEVTGYCKARPGWEAARREATAILLKPYQKRISENALLLVAGEEGVASSVERPWRLEGAELQQVSLRAAQLAGARMKNADLTGAALAGADLRGAQLDGAVLDGADLGRADLGETSMIGATARQAILDGTRFEDADLRKAGLEGSLAFSEAPVLRGAQLEGACIAGAVWREPARGVELCGLVGIEEARWRSDKPVGLAGEGLIASRLEPAWHRGDVNGVAFSPDGDKLATACSDRMIQVWDARTGRLLQTLNGHAKRVNSVVWARDGRSLITGSYDHTARSWEVSTGRVQRTFEGHTNWVTSVDWTANGERLVTGSYDKTARIWDAQTGQLLRTLEGHTGAVMSVAWTADGQFIATASDDETARVWEGRTGQLLWTLKGHTAPVSSVAWTRDGERLATGSYDNSVCIWETRTGRRVQSFEEVHTGPVSSVRWSADGERLATGSWDKTARIWEASTGQVLQTLKDYTKQITSVAWTADEARVATGSQDDTANIWDIRTGHMLLELPGKSNLVTSVAWSADGERLATGAHDRTARLWDARTGRVLQTLQGHTSYVMSVAWTTDGERLATGSSDKTARVWETRTGALLQTLAGHTSGVTSVAWTADGARLATGSWDRTARVWEARTGQLLQTLKGHTDTVASVAWAADGERLATGSRDRTARVWEARTGHLLRTLEGHVDEVTSVAWSADGERLATGSRDVCARVWEASTGRLLQTMKAGTRTISSVAWSEDGARLAAGSSDTARVWEVSTGRLLQTLRGHERAIMSVAWSPDGDRLATGSSDATARIWSVADARELVTLLHPIHGGVAFSGIHALPTADVDLSTLVVRTGSFYAPVELYADLCSRPELVAEALTGNPAPSLHVPMDTAVRSIAAAAHEALVPVALDALLPIKAGFKTPIQAPWSIPEALCGLHGFHLTLKALLPAGAIEIPVDPRCTTIDLPALLPGTHQLLLTLHLGERYERSFPFPLTVLAQNPYIAGPPVRGANLLGREADLARIRARLENGSIRLAGERRIGKTSTLHHFFDHSGPGFVPVWLDAQTLDDDASFRDWILSALHERFPDAPAAQSDLFTFLRASAAAGQTPLLLIDEIVHLRGLSVRDAGLLRSLSVTPFASILAGSPSDWSQFFAALPHDAGSPFNTLQDVFLGPLTEAQMRGLILQPGVAPPDDATMARILALCGGRPYLAQRLCEAALDRTYAEGRMRMELADIEAVTRETLVTGLAHQHEKRWGELAGTPAAQAAIVAHARTSAAAPRALHDTLREHGLFDGLEWTVDSAFMMWIRERETT